MVDVRCAAATTHLWHMSMCTYNSGKPRKTNRSPSRLDAMYLPLLAAGALCFAPCQLKSTSRNAASGPAWFQTFWEPCVQCCNQTRVGRSGDGGKWVCTTRLSSPVLVSVGSNNDFSFEVDFNRRFSARSIDVYDHTSSAHSDTRIRFHRTMMTSARLTELIRRGPIDVLKVDCEGCELDLFSDNVLRMLSRMKSQILLEVHWSLIGQSGIVELWGRFNKAGYGPFHKEPNIQFSDGSCVEYAFAVIRE